MASRKDDLPAPTRPTIQLNSPLRATKLTSSRVWRPSFRSHAKVASRTLTDSSPLFAAASFVCTASSCNSSAVRKLVRRPTATVASIIDVITIGRTAKGKPSRLKSVRAGKTSSVVKGSVLVRTKTVKVEHDTRNGVVDQVKFAKAWEAPIFRRVFNSCSFRIKLNLFMKA